jgi:predicted nucleotidyltransferase
MKTLAETRLEARERDALGEAVCILKRGFPVVRVVLFGSKARGEGHPESDLDLLVLTSRALGWRERGRLVDSLFEVELAYDVVLSPLIVAHSEWEEGPLSGVPLRAEVDRDGIPV